MQVKVLDTESASFGFFIPWFGLGGTYTMNPVPASSTTMPRLNAGDHSSGLLGSPGSKLQPPSACDTSFVSSMTSRRSDGGSTARRGVVSEAAFEKRAHGGAWGSGMVTGQDRLARIGKEKGALWNRKHASFGCFVFGPNDGYNNFLTPRL